MDGVPSFASPVGGWGNRRHRPASALSNWRKIKDKAAGEQSGTVIANQQGQE